MKTKSPKNAALAGFELLSETEKITSNYVALKPIDIEANSCVFYVFINSA